MKKRRETKASLIRELAACRRQIANYVGNTYPKVDVDAAHDEMVRTIGALKARLNREVGSVRMLKAAVSRAESAERIIAAVRGLVAEPSDFE